MTIVSCSTSLPVGADWRDLEAYAWMMALPRTAWAWEFLRRNPDYANAYIAYCARSPFYNEPHHSKARFWSLLRFENPARDARTADVLWQMKARRDVLPLAASPMRSGTAADTLALSRLACRATVYDYGVENRREVLFAQDGRSLQLTIFGETPLEEALLLTPALPSAPYDKSRLMAVRRLTDLVKYGFLRPALYKREQHATRLAQVIQALDGALAKASHREIAAALFTPERVRREWSDPGNHLRDRVRRAIGYGRALMLGKYRRFLR